jgi:hypothetical protein
LGLFKDSFKLVNELVTFGGAGRLEDAKRVYEEAHGRLQSLLSRANGYKTRINDAVAAIGSVLTQAKPHLEDAERLIKCRVGEALDLDVAVTTQTLHKVEIFNAGVSSAISAGVGSIAGGTMAVGAWSLVTVFGSASTGAAISGLSGVAATNATLAWFGGGAVAAGGAGMAGGMTVLGGIVAIPLVYIAAMSTHKKAKEFEDAKVEVEEAIVETRRQVETLPSFLKLVEARRHETEGLCSDVVAKIVELKKVIQPLGLISVAKQKILAFIGKQPYAKAQLDALAELTIVLATFLAAFDAHESGAASEMQKALR